MAFIIYAGSLRIDKKIDRDCREVFHHILNIILSRKLQSLQVKLTKLFDRKQCRSCGGRVTVKKVCLSCNEPSAIWCENCFM